MRRPAGAPRLTQDLQVPERQDSQSRLGAFQPIAHRLRLLRPRHTADNVDRVHEWQVIGDLPGRNAGEVWPMTFSALLQAASLVKRYYFDRL